MDEKQLHQILAIGAICLAAITGVASVGLLIATVADTFWAIIPAIIAALFCAASVLLAVYFGERVKIKSPVFENAAEQEVLNPKQRRDLRKARGEVVMERALIDIDNERQNIVHNQITDGGDPDKPPFETKFSKSYPPVEHPQRRIASDRER